MNQTAPDKAEILQKLLTLSHELGAEHRHLAILGEGNTSAKLDEHHFLVKASGSTLGSLKENQVVECRAPEILSLLDREGVSDTEVDDTLMRARVDPAARKPSVEALFHAQLLSLPDVRFVGHTHPVSVNSVLCSPRAEEFAARRIFPDEVVCCGPRSVFVPYLDPGLQLARAIRRGTLEYIDKHAMLPRVILLKSHGIITLGASPESVKAAMFMAVKAAGIFSGAAVLGGPVFMNDADIERIGNRPDEHYRQRALNL
jgi:rhamnose utilization protein RhaD (predicted bifunctional aldolase and dehydrogenase)